MNMSNHTERERTEQYVEHIQRELSKAWSKDLSFGDFRDLITEALRRIKWIADLGAMSSTDESSAERPAENVVHFDKKPVA
jgi:hypothetical protein